MVLFGMLKLLILYGNDTQDLHGGSVFEKYKKRQKMISLWKISGEYLEALSVDDGRTGFVVFGLGDPHGLEGRERGKDRTTDPDGVPSLWGSDDLDLHGGWGEGGDFLLHSIGNTGVPLISLLKDGQKESRLTWWCRQRGRCWRRDPFGYRYRTS